MAESRFRRRVLIGVTIVVAVWMFAGPLFAWLPIHPGFTVLKTPNTVIVYRDPPGLHVSTEALTKAFIDLETGIGLSFKGPTRFVLCDTWSDLTRFVPWLRVSRGVGAVTLPIGLATYVTPVVRNREDLLAFMKHEATHVLLYQHASIRHRLTIERQAWIVEGIGVRFGNPESYETWAEFVHDARDQNLVTVIDPDASGHRPGIGGFRFSYSAYGFFVQTLVERFGQERFQRYVRSYLADPIDYRRTFTVVFGVGFDEAITWLDRASTGAAGAGPHGAKRPRNVTPTGA